MIEFVKMHGTGNDFLVIEDFDNRLDIPADAVRSLCDRHFGIGGDGIIRLARGVNAPYFMDYRNADGSISETCGNGVRVCGKWLGDRGYADDKFALETRAGVQQLVLERGVSGKVENITVDMGAPKGDVQNEVLEVDGQPHFATLVNMPNPHAVLVVADVESAPVVTLGPRIEHHSRFPAGTNVEFIELRNGIVHQRTWERGSGETLACGSGACAVAVAAIQGNLASSPVEIELLGGRLRLEWIEGGSVTMTGPAAEVYSGAIDPVAFGIGIFGR